MNNTLKCLLRYSLWAVLILLGLFVILNVVIAVRYSREYVSRELFMDLGNVYDYRILPERKLTASPDPFQPPSHRRGYV